MGALHAGHRALVKRAGELAGESGSVILSLFINPTQFDRSEDLNNYPRTLEADLEICRQDGVNLVFTPNPNHMYCDDHSLSVVESSLSNQLCGATRPGHFNGVCTVVLKLFNLSRADIAIFGKKDYQQLAIIRRMVRDLNVPIQIEGLETMREPSGLAMSSRNSQLDPHQKEDAARIRRALLIAQKSYCKGERSAHTVLELVRQEIQSSDLVLKIDYLEILDAETLQAIEIISQPAIIATAVFYGNVRLIDNIEINSSH